jgi:REP element-mobilizing transposase RayT
LLCPDLSLSGVILDFVMKKARQLGLSLPPVFRWGGHREGARRKPGSGPRDPHRKRPALAARHPAFVTLKVRRGLPSLRLVALVRELERSFARACDRGEFRLVEYSIQTDHVHALVEAESREALARGMKAIGARLARAVNRIFRRRGPVLAARFHLRVLRSPREVRNALAYVLLNARRHAAKRGRARVAAVRIDPASSGAWFDGWRCGTPRPPERASPVALARTWLLRVGWRRHGLIDPGEVPGR